MMRKALLLAVVLTMSLGAFAQKGEMSIGLRGNYFRTEHGAWANQAAKKGHFGVGLQFNYGITDHLRMAHNYNYFFEKEGLTSYDVNLDFHYLIPIVPKLTVYPIVGASLLGMEQQGELLYEDTQVGANLGAGVQFDLCRRWFVHADYTCKVMNNVERSNVALGVGFKF